MDDLRRLRHPWREGKSKKAKGKKGQPLRPEPSFVFTFAFCLFTFAFILVAYLLQPQAAHHRV
jgi:hypothetical protein